MVRPKVVAKVDEPPLVLIRTVADRQLVVALSDEARMFGVRAGMTLTEARALCPRLVNADHDAAADARGLEALARWMHRFTPVVALPSPSPACSGEGRGEGRGEGDCVFLDLTGCERVFGSLSNIVQMVAAAMEGMNLSFGIAVAPTPGAAWALASFKKQLQIENCELQIENHTADNKTTR